MVVESFPDGAGDDAGLAGGDGGMLGMRLYLATCIVSEKREKESARSSRKERKARRR